MSTVPELELFAPPRITLEERPDGSLLLRSQAELGQYERSMAHVLRRRAELHPERALMVLSGNSLEHLLVTLGAYTAGIPVAPVSVAYSLLSRDHERIRWIAELVRPGLMFADDAEQFGAALDALAGIVPAAAVARNPEARPNALRLDDLASKTPGGEVEDALEAVGPDTVAKLLFTSGSTGAPKGVINTHRMLCSNQQALGQVWPFLHDGPPILV